MYIVMEGHDGTGKSTQVRMLSETLRKRGLEVVAAKEPGGTLVAERVRKMTKDKELDLDKYVSQLLLTAARVDLWLRVIQPALDRRAIVISDRSWFSALAYACAQGMSENEVLKITVDLMPERLVHPDLAFVFMLSDEERRRRMLLRSGMRQPSDMFESKSDMYQKRVDKRYMEIARKYSLHVIDTAPSPKEVHAEVMRKFDGFDINSA